ncbi:hypothetical protein [Actinomadura sp. 9N407]|uniref:hypothetical protein n=1 Tax=Actinomadura sp. 9N407 TaxID=3375154 RepID=UPI00379CDDC9
MTAQIDAPVTVGRVRTAWRGAHAPVAGVPRWARIAAYTVPLTVLPSGLWRIAGITFHLPIDINEGGHGSGDLPSWLPMELYVVLLSVLSELLAFTAIGLIARWGEVFPRWIPGLGGRRVPTRAVVVTAALGAAVLTVVWTVGFVALFAGVTVTGEPTPADFPTQAGGWQAAIFYLCYLPLLLWGPLLAAVTFAYHRRRRNH